MSILDKDTIKNYILPYLSEGKTGVKLSEEKRIAIVETVFYRLKTGCQWRELPLKMFFKESYTYQSVHYHFSRWVEDGSWKQAWLSLLEKYKKHLDLSSVQLDGSQTRAQRGGESVGFQRRKADETSNFLYVCDNQGVLVGISEPISGNHHDIFDFEKHFLEVLWWFEQADISVKGLFLNADAGFDTEECRKVFEKKEIEANIPFNERNGEKDRCELFDEELFKRRFVIERTFAWMDAFKALLIRYEVKAQNWLTFNLIAMMVIFIRKMKI
ncbi:MAG: IS5 family transposase [Acidobacteria bacterium]|nr:MAG: IS5 family transposase [Acidobacteriota bacterium]